MGRHSAPDDDDGDLLVAEAAPVQERPRPRPRHAVADAELVRTEIIEPELVERAADAPPRDVVDAVVVEDETYPVRPAEDVGPIAELTSPPRPAPVAPAEPVAAPAAAPAPALKPARERPSRTDLRLLRSSSSLRARCLAAVLLPFILYTIVLVVIGRVDAYLFWIWIPAILAGVLFGAQLDGAQKRLQAPPPTE